MTKSQQPSVGKFIDPLLDFSFKRIFGTEPNQDLLIAFLNGVFHGRKDIKRLVYNKNEHVGDTDELGSVIFDLTCTASDGEQFIIEVQRTAQINLKRRMLYYGSKLISDQAPKGRRKEWDYAIPEVYVIVLMDGFAMPGGGHDDRYLHDICLCNRDTGEVFYDDLGFIYLELRNFAKEESELETDLDGWLYVLKNMSKLNKIPLYLRKPIFEKLFNIAEYSKLTKEEKEMYDTSLKRKWDTAGALEYARREGEEKGIEKGFEKGAKQKSYNVVANLIQQLGFDDAAAAGVAEVSVDFVRKVRADLAKKKK
ncbi:Rpn family recombination-promoting nuclease/putative transposase [Parapedobacter sp. 2B3]|uniref:Rpn family recombination-promoting nuclease/putative transposase n=1 Tax=Parapedobacter sp. 2B3 TaxID=3342381 RepID=UPI0035B5FF77